MEAPCTNVVYDDKSGSIICVDTGEVLEDHAIDPGPWWRVFSAEEWIQKTQASSITFSVHDLGLVTDIDLSASGFRARRRQLEFSKMRKLHRQLRVKKEEKKLVEALMMMNKYAAMLGLPNEVKETAGQILKKLFTVMKPKQSKLSAYVAAALVKALKIHGIPRRVKEVLSVMGVSEEDYWNANSDISFKLNLASRPLDPRQFISKIVTNLGLSTRVMLVASKIIDVLKRRGYTEGKDPAGIAAAAVYVASIILNEKRTQKEIAMAANVTEVTIRNRYRDIIDKLYIEVLV